MDSSPCKPTMAVDCPDLSMCGDLGNYDPAGISSPASSTQGAGHQNTEPTVIRYPRRN